MMSAWVFQYDTYEPESEKLRETLCTLGNGYFATRGAAPESHADKFHYPGTYVAGCYNRLEDTIHGTKIENESLVNCPNWLPVTFRIGGRKWFDIRNVKILTFSQKLDVRKGILYRKIKFKEKRGRISTLFQRRFVHMEYRHLAGLETKLRPENWSGSVQFLSALDGNVTNSGVERYNDLSGDHTDPEEENIARDDILKLSVRTSQSKVKIALSARNKIFKNGEQISGRRRKIARRGYVGEEFSVRLKEGETVSVQKIVSLHTSRDFATSDPSFSATMDITQAPEFSDLVKTQELSWKYLWRMFWTRIKGDERAALAVHMHIFHLLQTASKNTIDLDVSVPARGLHGEAYRGHVLWDELFIFPVLNLHIPDLTRSLLMYRYRRLPKARLLARDAGFRGALFPWQSASDGREESQIIHLNPVSKRWIADNSHLQWHINVAIAYNVWSYFQVTHDLDFLSSFGAEMMIEIARFFGSVARYDKAKDRYVIEGNMGPDEYHDAYPDSEEPGLANNAYTNIMVVWVIMRTLESLDLISKRKLEEIWSRLELTRHEVERWKKISRTMFVPIHDGIIQQFEGYDKLEEFDWEGYKKKYGNIERLDRILEAEGDSPNNYKVSKQADVLMLFYLLSSKELQELFTKLGYNWERDTIPKNIEYYTKRTSHGSTLSRVVHSWVISRLDREQSWQIAKQALESDLSDIQGGTTEEGIHLGAMAGTIDIFERAYMGLVTRNDILYLDPLLPDEIRGILFTILYRGHAFDLKATPTLLEVKSPPGYAEPITICFRNSMFEIRPGDKRRFRL